MLCNSWSMFVDCFLICDVINVGWRDHVTLMYALCVNSLFSLKLLFFLNAKSVIFRILSDIPASQMYTFEYYSQVYCWPHTPRVLHFCISGHIHSYYSHRHYVWLWTLWHLNSWSVVHYHQFIFVRSRCYLYQTLLDSNIWKDVLAKFSLLYVFFFRTSCCFYVYFTIM